MEEDEPTTSSAFVAALPAGYVLQWLLKPTQRSQLRKFARNHRLAALLDRSAVIVRARHSPSSSSDLHTRTTRQEDLTLFISIFDSS